MRMTKEEKEAFQGGVIAGTFLMFVLTFVFVALLEVF